MHAYVKVYAGAVACLVVLTAIASTIGAAQLDRATARQCANADWPAKLDDAHRDFCKANGYAVLVARR